MERVFSGFVNVIKTAQQGVDIQDARSFSDPLLLPKYIYGDTLTFLTRMFDNLVYQNAVFNGGLDLLRDGALLRIFIRAFLGRKHDVDGRALAREDLGFQALRGEVDGRTVNLVHE